MANFFFSSIDIIFTHSLRSLSLSLFQPHFVCLMSSASFSVVNHESAFKWFFSYSFTYPKQNIFWIRFTPALLSLGLFILFPIISTIFIFFFSLFNSISLLFCSNMTVCDIRIRMFWNADSTSFIQFLFKKLFPVSFYYLLSCGRSCQSFLAMFAQFQVHLSYHLSCQYCEMTNILPISNDLSISLIALNSKFSIFKQKAWLKTVLSVQNNVTLN